MHIPWRPRAWLPLSLALVLRGMAHAGEDAATSVTFLEGEKGRDAIVDESIEPYFSLLQPMEMAAKTGKPLEAHDLAAQREECRQRYREAIRDFTDREKASLTELTRRIDAAWKDEYPLFANTPWSFLKVAYPIEGGMPHTRGKSIVLTDVAMPVFTRASRDARPAALMLPCEILVHEQSHVVQRLHPEVFSPLYTGPWGLVRAAGIKEGPWLEKRQVLNPDGIDAGWVLPVGGKDLVQPFVILSDGPEPRSMPGDFETIGVSVVKSGGGFTVRTDGDGKPLFRTLEDVREYEDRFGAVDENFHPNETFACFFSQMVVHDHFGGGGLRKPSDLVGPDFKKLRAWCREHFGAKAPAGK